MDNWKMLYEVAFTRGMNKASLRHRTARWERLGWAKKIDGAWRISPEAEAEVGVTKKIQAADAAHPLAIKPLLRPRRQQVPKAPKTDQTIAAQFKEIEQRVREDERAKLKREYDNALHQKVRFVAVTAKDHPNELDEVVKQFLPPGS